MKKETYGYELWFLIMFKWVSTWSFFHFIIDSSDQKGLFLFFSFFLDLSLTHGMLDLCSIPLIALLDKIPLKIPGAKGQTLMHLNDGGTCVVADPSVHATSLNSYNAQVAKNQHKRKRKKDCEGGSQFNVQTFNVQTYADMYVCNDPSPPAENLTNSDMMRG